MATIAEEEKKKRGSYGDAAAAALDSDVTQLKYGKPGDFPVNPDGTPMQKMGFGPSAAVPAPDAQGGAAFAPGTRAVMSGFGEDAKALSEQGKYGAVVGQLGRAVSAMPIAMADDLLGPAIGMAKPLLQGGANAIKTFVTGDNTQANVGLTKPAATQKVIPGAGDATMPGNDPTRFMAPAPVVAPTAATESAPDGSPLGKDVGYGIRRIDAPGKSPLFTNVGNADNAALMGRSGAVSAQNQNAAQILSDRYAGEARNAAAVDQYNHEVAAAQAINARPIAKDTGGFGLLSKEYQDRRNASFAPSSLQGDTARNAYVLAQNKALDDQSLENVKSDRDEARVSARERGATDRAILQEQGVNSRFGMSNKIAQQKADAEQQKLGFDTKAASQIQALQQQIISDDGKDPRRTAALHDKMQAITSKYQRPEPANRDVYGAIAGGTDAMGNKTDPIIYNKQTGERAVAQGPVATPKVDEVRGGYKFKGGNPADQKNWEKV
jgi:hypothetical protein